MARATLPSCGVPQAEQALQFYLALACNSGSTYCSMYCHCNYLGMQGHCSNALTPGYTLEITLYPAAPPSTPRQPQCRRHRCTAHPAQINLQQCAGLQAGRTLAVGRQAAAVPAARASSACVCRKQVILQPFGQLLQPRCLRLQLCDTGSRNLQLACEGAAISGRKLHVLWADGIQVADAVG